MPREESFLISLNETPPRRNVRCGGSIGEKLKTSEAKTNANILILQGKDGILHLISTLRTNCGESVGRTSLRHLTNRKVEVETADDGSSRRGRTGFIVFFLEVDDLEVEEEWSTLSLGGRSVDEQLEKGAAESEEAGF